MNDKVHLLLIDDEKNYLLVLETLLTEAGYAVTALNDPETALAFLEESEVDIVITDMKMPRISGREVLEPGQKELAPHPGAHHDGLRLHRKRCGGHALRGVQLHHQAVFQRRAAAFHPERRRAGPRPPPIPAAAGKP